MEKANKTLLPIIVILLCTLIIAIIPTEAEAMIYEDTVRLHIRAASDSEEDQRVKLAVRDKLLSEYGEIFKDFSDRESAEAEISESIDEIVVMLESFLQDMGYGYSVTAELTTEWFDTRTYENFTLPMGYYRSLIIELGEGEGKNWWCVMYPPLCLDIATGKEALTESEDALISHSGYRVKFKVLEGISGLFK